MKSKILKCTGLMISLIFVFSLFPYTVAADVVWEDNFDDMNYDGWTVKTGSFSCADKTLVGTTDTTPGGPTNTRFDNEIWINSTVSYGTWSFDLYYGVQTNYGPGLWFTCDTISSDAEWIGVGWPGGKGLAVQREGNSWYFHRVNGWTGGNLATWNATPDGLDGLETGYHVYFTYNETGYFNMWINGTHFSQAANFHSEYHFQSQNVLIAMNNGSWIDNIEVWNSTIPYEESKFYTPTTTTTTTPPDNTTTNGGTTPPPLDTTLLIVGAGVAGVVIVAAVVFMRRR